MIKNRHKLNRFYRGLLRKERLSYAEALRIFEALHREAVSLGVIQSNNLLGGIETDVAMVRLIHRLAK